MQNNKIKGTTGKAIIIPTKQQKQKIVQKRKR